jgi:tetratricopeptide (TPR) repeat protein
MAAQALLDRINQADQDSTSGTDVISSARSFYTPLQRPPRADHFIGRETELAHLQNNLKPGQVVTLCGPGGIGKSALAAEAVWTLAPHDAPPDRFPGGVIYHDFYSHPQATLALEHIVRSFDEELQPTPRDAAQRVLAEQPVLLVLDGAEQVDDLSEVLAIRGNCGVLITSRQDKDVIERYDIAPLPLNEAVSLLSAWGWVQTLDETAARQICELVGGSPLAVRLAGHYLAAHRIGMTDYLEWLQQTPLRTLNQSRRCEESIFLLLEHSLTRASEIARQVIGGVGLLAIAPFGQEVMAEALARGTQQGFLGTIRRIFKQKPEEPTPEVSLALDELVSYGLLQWVGQGYKVSHPLIHTYARQRMTALAGATRRLVDYYTTLVGEQILLGLDGYARLDAERPHLMGILARCIEREEWDAAHNLAASIEDYLDLQGHWTERVIANGAGLVAARKSGRSTEATWLGNLGLAYNNIGQARQAIEYYEQALAIARNVGDRRSEGNLLGNMGLAYRDLEQVEQARQYLEQSLAIFEEIQSPSTDIIRDWLAEFEDE